jgi:hypothetical protein
VRADRFAVRGAEPQGLGAELGVLDRDSLAGDATIEADAQANQAGKNHKFGIKSAEDCHEENEFGEKVTE